MTAKLTVLFEFTANNTACDVNFESMFRIFILQHRKGEIFDAPVFAEI